MNFELFNSSGIVSECIRQWIVLIASSLIIPYLFLAIKNLGRSKNNLKFEQLILSLEATKIMCFTIVTFLLPTVAGYILVLAISSEIRALICGAFLARTLVLFNYKSVAIK